MLEHRGVDRSVIVRYSVHNQRIERLWRDMHRRVTVVYYRLWRVREYWIQWAREISMLFIMCSYLVSTGPFILFKRAGTTMVFVLSTTGLQISFSPLRLQHAGLVAGSRRLWCNWRWPCYWRKFEQRCTYSKNELSPEHFQLLVDLMSESNNYGMDLYLQVIEFLDDVVTT